MKVKSIISVNLFLLVGLLALNARAESMQSIRCNYLKQVMPPFRVFHIDAQHAENYRAFLSHCDPRYDVLFQQNRTVPFQKDGAVEHRYLYPILAVETLVTDPSYEGGYRSEFSDPDRVVEPTIGFPLPTPEVERAAILANSYMYACPKPEYKVVGWCAAESALQNMIDPAPTPAPTATPSVEKSSTSVAK